MTRIETDLSNTNAKNLDSHSLIKDGWFREISDKSFPGQAFTLKVEKILYSARTEFQDILVFASTHYGNVLVLDGIIQCTERDEFAYQEMMAHVSLYSHENPQRVLVIGGGDGGVLREVLKHSCVQNATLVEIDETIIKLSQRYFPKMSTALPREDGSLPDERVHLKLCDGFQFLQDVAKGPQEEKFDVIITDSSDPEGPAEAFFHKEYFQLLKDSLIDPKHGIIISQTSENVWLNVPYLSNLVSESRQVFNNVQYCYTMVPSYTSGQLGLLICNDDPARLHTLNEPVRYPTAKEQNQLHYYNKEIHSASFVLPKWVESQW